MSSQQQTVAGGLMEKKQVLLGPTVQRREGCSHPCPGSGADGAGSSCLGFKGRGYRWPVSGSDDEQQALCPLRNGGSAKVPSALPDPPCSRDGAQPRQTGGRPLKSLSLCGRLVILPNPIWPQVPSREGRPHLQPQDDAAWPGPQARSDAPTQP